MKKIVILLVPVAIIPMLLVGCNDDEIINLPGSISVNIQHLADGLPVIYDQMIYVNEAGNQYEVSEIQWFISDLTLKRSDGSLVLLDAGNFAHYVDTDIPATWNWIIPDPIMVGEYSSIILTFGLKGEKNIPLTFPDSPESDMIWPYPMGGDNGGYHYMKFNGFWLDPGNLRQAFNFHLGVGKVGEEFIQNWFEVELENSNFSVKEGEHKVITLNMNIENWFKDPYVYDHNVFGAKIMNNQEAMGMATENGKIGVFTVGSISNE